MNANERYLKEAKELEKHWNSRSTVDIPYIPVTASMLQSHRMPGEAICKVCKELASYSRNSPDDGWFEYFCSEDAPENASCFVKKEALHKFK